MSWAYFSTLPNAPRDKRERRRLLAERALALLGEWQASLDRQDAALPVPA